MVERKGNSVAILRAHRVLHEEQNQDQDECCF